MDLYRLHSNPESLANYDIAGETVPYVAWEKYRDNNKEMKKREHIWALYPEYAYKYAKHILKGSFPKGEAIMAQHPAYAYWYARLIDGPFPEGEAAIAKSARYAFDYARDIIKGPFPEGEAAIQQKPVYAHMYIELLHQSKQ